MTMPATIVRRDHACAALLGRAGPTPSTNRSHQGTNTTTASHAYGSYQSWNARLATTTAIAVAVSRVMRDQSASAHAGTTSAVASSPSFSASYGRDAEPVRHSSEHPEEERRIEGGQVLVREVDE